MTPKVILRHCDTYDPERIRAIVREGLQELDLRPRGRTLVKPNLVIALRSVFEHSFTRPEFADGVLGALADRAGDDLTELAVGERCGITIPTRMAFKHAGYGPVIKKHRVKRYLFEEELQVPIELRHPDRLRDVVYTPEPVARADFFVNMPKLKAHPWTTVTMGCKNYIGIQDDRHRLIDHDHRLDEKIADLQEIVQPQFLCMDAIIAGEGRMLTAKPFPLNLIVMANNQPAMDAVGSRILGLDPSTIDHIRLCSERGYGPIDAGAIEISGDVTLEEAQKRAAGFEVGLVRVEDYFRDSPIQALAGPPPEPERTDYCWGGCPGSIEEAIEVIRAYQPDVYAKMRPVTVIFGDYRGPIELRDKKEKVIFAGDCCCWKGELRGKAVDIPSLYVGREHKDPRHASMDDLIQKTIKAYWNCWIRYRGPYLRLLGCPSSVAEQVLSIAITCGTINPYLAPKSVIPFTFGWTGWRLAQIGRALTGKRYQSKAIPEPARATALPAAKEDS